MMTFQEHFQLELCTYIHIYRYINIEIITPTDDNQLG